MDERQYLEAVTALLPGIAARVEDTEQLRRIPDATIKELRDSGLMKALQPARWGGRRARANCGASSIASPTRP